MGQTASRDKNKLMTVSLVFEADGSNLSSSDLHYAVEQNINVIKKRIQFMGIQDYTVEKLGDRRIEVVLHGVSDQEYVEHILLQTGFMEIKPIVELEKALEIIQEIDEYIKNNPDKVSSNDDIALRLNAYPNDGIFRSLINIEDDNLVVSMKDRRLLQELLLSDEVRNAVPLGYEIRLGGLNRVSKSSTVFLYVLNSNYLLKMRGLESAAVIADSTQTLNSGEYIQSKIKLKFGREGSHILKRITTDRFSSKLALLSDKVVIAIIVNDRVISDGVIVLSDNYSTENAGTIALLLDSGYFSVAMILISRRVEEDH